MLARPLPFLGGAHTLPESVWGGVLGVFKMVGAFF